jgi:hypothetical protein
MNGDGYADLVVSSASPVKSDSLVTYWAVFLGGPGGIGTTPGATCPACPARDGFVYGLASAGDVQGDGYADLALTYEPLLGDAGVAAGVYLYAGGAAIFATQPTSTLVAQDGGYFGMLGVCGTTQ